MYSHYTDPYVVTWTTSTQDNKVRTKTIENGGTEAIWEETFDITVKDDQVESVYFEVMNRNDLKL
jgi:hypothetical protein